MFTAVPTYGRFRTACYAPKAEPAEDVFALQCALTSLLKVQIKTDGVFGAKTRYRVRQAQKRLGVTVDGLVGSKTWIELSLALAGPVEAGFNLPEGTLHGQLEHESGLRGGMYSWLIRAAASRPDHPNKDLMRLGKAFDAGDSQLNSDLYSLVDAFDPQYAIHLLGASIRAHYDLFKGVRGRRRWDLAQGAWNAPAYAKWLAKQEGARIPARDTAKPGTTALATLEQYMANVSVYRK